MEWKKPFALFAGFFGFLLSFVLCFNGDYLTDPHVAQDCIPLGQDCSDVWNWKCKPITMLMCTYLDDFKSFGYDNSDAKIAIVFTCLFYMILNQLLFFGLINEKPGFIYGYQIGNVLSTIALMSTLVYVSYFREHSHMTSDFWVGT